MVNWELQCGETKIQVQADNWLVAVGRSLKTFGIAQEVMGRFVCELHPGGVASVRDSETGILIGAKALEQSEAVDDAPPLVLPVPMLMPVLAGPSPDFDDLTDPGRYVAPPDLTAWSERSEDNIAATQDRKGCCRVAMNALLEMIKSESAAVLLIGDDGGLRFVDARGPHADGVVGMTIPAGQGIAGTCAQTGNSFIVLDTQSSPQHYDQVDRSTGYRTQDMLAAAIKDPEGKVLGVIELLNPGKTFVPWHLEAACAIADMVAQRLSRL